MIYTIINTKGCTTLWDHDACAACGYPIVPDQQHRHYVSRSGSHHCNVCHELGKDWRNDGDSEKV